MTDEKMKKIHFVIFPEYLLTDKMYANSDILRIFDDLPIGRFAHEAWWFRPTRSAAHKFCALI